MKAEVAVVLIFHHSLACTQTLCYFSFRSFQKHRRWQSINPPAVYILSPTLDGL